jgi:type 1 glutamine amidotransferase
MSCKCKDCGWLSPCVRGVVARRMLPLRRFCSAHGWAAVLALFLCLSLLPSAIAGEPLLRVLVVTGGHSHDASFYALFENHPDLHVVVEPHPSAFTKRLIEQFDVIVLYDMVQEHHVPEVQRQKLKAFAESGKGLLVVHHALVSYQQWDWYGLDLVGGRYLLEPRGSLPKSLYEHDVEQMVHPVSKHPIVAGMKPFRLVDETYERMQVVPDAHILLRTNAKGSNDAVAWISPYRQSRVVALQLGHDRQAIATNAYHHFFHRALRWAGQRELATASKEQ